MNKLLRKRWLKRVPYQWWWVVRTNLRVRPCELATSRTFSGSTGSTAAASFVLSSTILRHSDDSFIKIKRKIEWRNVRYYIQIGIIVLEACYVMDSHFFCFPIQQLPHAQFLLPTSQHLISNRHRDVLIYNGIILWEKQCKISLVCLWSLVWREGIYSRTQLILDPIFWFHVFKINSVQN